MTNLTGEQVEHLRSMEEDGRLTPEQVVADARRKNSPLHGLFEWDVKRAATAYWTDQAQRIIRQVHVMVTTRSTEVRVVRYVPDPAPLPRPSCYINTDALTEDQHYEVIAQEANRALGHMRRVANLAASFEMDAGLDSIIEAWEVWRDSMAPVAEPMATAAD